MVNTVLNENISLNAKMLGICLMTWWHDNRRTECMSCWLEMFPILLESVKQ